MPLTSVLSTATGGWHLVFYIAAAMNAVAALLAIAVLKPMRLSQARADLERRIDVDYAGAELQPGR